MYEIRLSALAFLGLMYVLKLAWLFRFRSSRERTFPAGDPGRGVALSLLNVALPLKMESTRRHFGFYGQFVLFHLGVLAVILISFIIPFWPWMLDSRLAIASLQVVMGAAALIGLFRFARRWRQANVRLISTPDDYLSLALMVLYLASGVLAAPARPPEGEGTLIVFFALTTLFEIYVPFSKISHYLYYPFTRFFLGRNLGHRGVVAKLRSEV
jgi:hypothetical protein